MKITKTENGYRVERDGVTMFVPEAPGNADYHMVQQAIADGAEVIVPSPPLITAEQARANRDRLLDISDWTQLQDAPVDQATWAVYRQALRDVPQQAGFPHDVVWPTKPE